MIQVHQVFQYILQANKNGALSKILKPFDRPNEI